MTEASNLSVERADLQIDSVELAGCDNVWIASVTIEDAVNALDGTDTVPVPGGQWCGIAVLWSGTLVLEGVTDGGTTFDITLTPAEIELWGSFAVDGNDLVLQLPLLEFINAAELEALGDDVSIAPDDALGIEWADELAADAVLVEGWTDTVLADAAGSPPSAFRSADADCGCTASPAGSWLLLPLLLLLPRRRLRP